MSTVTETISFFRAADWAETHKCDTRRALGTCTHKGCRQADEIYANLLARGMDESLPNDWTLEEIADWASRKSCDAMRRSGYRGCSRHKWCNESGPIILWLFGQATAEKQAAG